jgi:hypothetical protein
MSTDQTSNLGLPFLMPAQAQKHVTVNESLLRLDALVQMQVQSRSISSQPGSPSDGQVWIAPAGKTGPEWGGYADWSLAHYRDGAWEAIAPREGWRAWVADEEVFVRCTGSAWTSDQTAGSLNGGPLAGFRNVVVNGGLDHWQRGTSFANASGYSADRMFVRRSGGAMGLTASRQTGPTGHRYALRLQRDAGNSGADALQVHYAAETADSIRFQGRRATLSFLARCGASYSPIGSGLAIAVVTGTGTDQQSHAFTGSVDQATATLTLTTSWQAFSLATPALPAGLTEIGLRLQATPTGTAGSNDWFEIAGLQLEDGGVATPFERRATAVELALCQRYFEKSYAQSAAPGAASYSGAHVTCAAAASFTDAIRFAACKRATPTIVGYNPQTGASGTWREYAASANRTFTPFNTATGGFMANCSGATPGSDIYLHWTADAEL